MKKILLIEDDFSTQKLYEHVLMKGGFDIICVSNGVVGYQKALEDDFSLILLDIMLPKKNGIDVLMYLKADRKTRDVPVIIISNLVHNEIISVAYAIGVKGYILKSNILPQQLVEVVKSYFETGIVDSIYNQIVQAKDSQKEI